MNTLERILANCVEYGECLLWQGPSHNGSPQFYIGGPGKKYAQARRLVYTLSSDRPIRNGYMPVMKCREPGCLKFEHMALLTPRELGALLAKEGKYSTPTRIAAIAKGKRASPAAKLDEAKALEIFNSTESGPVLEKKYGVHRSLICRIKRREAWAVGAPNNSVFNMRG